MFKETNKTLRKLQRRTVSLHIANVGEEGKHPEKI